jgi:hypothetical protein
VSCDDEPAPGVVDGVAHERDIAVQGLLEELDRGNREPAALETLDHAAPARAVRERAGYEQHVTSRARGCLPVRANAAWSDRKTPAASAPEVCINARRVPPSAASAFRLTTYTSSMGSAPNWAAPNWGFRP